MTRPLIDDCFRPNAPDRAANHDDVIALLKSRLSPIVDIEQVRLADANGRTLSTSITAPRDLPGHNNAAVDGFAFRQTDTLRERGGRLPLVGTAAAGHPFPGTVPEGAAVRILTGAVVPKGVDTVVMQEDADVTGAGESAGGAETVAVPAGLKPGANVRPAGEDARAGERLLDAGHRIRP
ncbi:MAG: molybdopterin molybdenumtransferase MoeA, partial [Pseudomonadota bacterium]